MRTSQGTIVVGVDGSDGSRRALRWASAQAVAEHRALTIVHTIGTVTPAYLDAAVVDVRQAQQALHDSARTLLETARRDAQRWAPGVDVLDVLEVADARELLLELSDGAAMVVVGSRGRGPVRSLLLGSVGVALVRHAHCPVVVVRPGNSGTVRNGVVVGVDALPESGPVLEFAYREASLHDLPLTVVHASSDGETAGLALAEVTAGMTEKYPDVRVTTRLTREPPHDLLVRLGERMNLVVVGAHQATGLERVRTASVSVTVVEHAACPVAVVPVRSRRGGGPAGE
jgi:nucleotide-binding universal stress UspA family protein